MVFASGAGALGTANYHEEISPDGATWRRSRRRRRAAAADRTTRRVGACKGGQIPKDASDLISTDQ